MRVLLLAIVALLLSPALARAAGETSIFYYPWWGTPQKDGKYLHWNKNGRLPPQDLASTFYPSRGAYSSRDWNVLSQQMAEIARAGVDEVVSSWWGLGSPEADRLPTLMRAAWKHGLDVAVHLEPYEKWQRTRAIVEADFEFLRDLGVGRVYVYYPFDGLIADAAWLELSAQFPSIELYAQTDDAARAASAGFDGVYTYDVYAVRGGAFAGFCARATQAGIACAPSVGPGYNASRATADDACGAAAQGRRTTACGARPSQPSPIASRSPAITSGTRARRSSPPGAGAQRSTARTRATRGPTGAPGEPPSGRTSCALRTGRRRTASPLR